jgi:hypothetical protein
VLGAGIALPGGAAVAGAGWESASDTGQAARALRSPRLLAPADGATVNAAPAFTWRRVRRAAEYEFQLSDDARFRSLLARGSIETLNTAATLEKSLPEGDYHWRVRGISASGSAGRWSRARSLSKRWSSRPTLVTPASGANVEYPGTPLVLRWDPVPHAAKYVLTVAADPSLASPVIGTATRPVETSGTAFAPEGSLDPGQYWWAVTPVNTVGHRGTRSEIRSFTWSWLSATRVEVTDLHPDPRVYDPQFSWDRIPGAARYEVEVNSSQDFAVGSRVCCTDKTIGTSLSPTKLFPNNTYYWRVRAFDVDGRPGVWNVGTPFQKTFDPVTPSVPALALRDNEGPLPPGAITDSPVVTWSPVPGASSYDVHVVPYTSVGGCNWSDTQDSWVIATATTAWTPLASGGDSPEPKRRATIEGDGLQDGTRFCVRVRARTGTTTSGMRVFSEWSYLNGFGGVAFEYDAPTGLVNTKLTTKPGDYLLPAPGSHASATPLFTWRHVPGACGYFIVVAKDAEFTTIVDVARTKIPAYAPRDGASPHTYPDETTQYYWAVFPVVLAPPGETGCRAVYSVREENWPQSVRKESAPPTPLGPSDGADVVDQPTFRWTGAHGAREYRLQVAHDPSFGSLIDDVVTASTAYTSSSTYPADALLYWRVRANDEDGLGLTWSATQTFRRRLPAPAPGSNPQAGEGIPVMSWFPVPGAVSYHVNVEEPDGDNLNFTLRSTVFTPVKVYGLGTWHWRVRANFPRSGAGVSSGAFSARRPFTRYINPPTGAHATRAAGALVVSWDPSFGLAKEYRVDFASSSSFTRSFDSERLDNTAYAPTLTRSGFQDGGRVYWRVAAVDEGGNLGAWASGRLGLLRRMVVRAAGRLQRGRRGLVQVRASDARGRAVRRARVSVRGAGIRARSRRTSRRGIARFRVRPRTRGKLAVRVDKRGFRPGSAVVAVH